MNKPNSEIALHVVLYQPEIPQNTGNIGRTCTALGAKLWIVQPAGFRLDSSRLKRAGLDYWDHLQWQVVANWDDLMAQLGPVTLWLLTKFGTIDYREVDFQPGCAIVVGRESNGLPESLRNSMPNSCIRIPMPGPVRSLNQASAAAIIMYQAAGKIGLLQ